MSIWLVAYITAKFLVRRFKYPKRILYWFVFPYYFLEARRIAIKSLEESEEGE